MKAQKNIVLYLFDKEREQGECHMENKKVNVRDLTILGMLSAIIIILGYTPIGLIPIPILNISASIIHIPVIVGAIILGPKKGTVLSAVMGSVSFLRALSAPGFYDQFFRNPLVSILPRIFIGLAAYYAYVVIEKLVKDNQKEAGWINQLIKVAAAAAGSIAGALANTVLTLSALLIAISFAFPDKLQEAMAVATTVVSTVGIAEMIGTAVIVPPIVYALKKLRY